MKNRIISILILCTVMFTSLPLKLINANMRPVEITQSEDEFSLFRESEHFLFDIPSSYLSGRITPEQLGWYLSEMDKLYVAMADFVGGKSGWLPSSQFDTGHQRKILMNYDADYQGDAVMTARIGETQINFFDGSVASMVWATRNGRIYGIAVHEVGHNFGPFPAFNEEWVAEFLTVYAAIVSETAFSAVSQVHGTDITLESLYQTHYEHQTRNYNWSDLTKKQNTRYGSILTCAILSFVRDHGWDAIKQAFGSYHDNNYPHDGQKHKGHFRAVQINEFIDRIDYFGDVDFRSEYLDYKDWLEYINSLFPVEPIEYVEIAGKMYGTHITELQLSNSALSNDDIENLIRMTSLRNLYLENNQISDISVLSGLQDLSYLTLNNNQISDISPLNTLLNLRGLELNNNQISCISPLSGLQNLGILYLNNNQISDISALGGLAKLHTLRLSNNRIVDISALKNLENLNQLLLRNNQITDLTPLFGMGTTVQHFWNVSLDLYNNPVTLQQVRELYLTMREDSIINHNAVCSECRKQEFYCPCPCGCDECGNCDPISHLLIFTDIIDGVSWIEIFNPTNRTISTKGLFITDDSNNLFLWQIPSLIIEANGFVLISNFDIEPTLNRAQVDFDVATSETLYLATASGRILAQWSELDDLKETANTTSFPAF